MRRARESGVAAITAVLIVAVAASAAAMMLAQQSATLDQALLVAARAQADEYAQAGVDWARGVLAEDARTGGAVDSLAEGWAQPIAALPVERAVVSGAIDDEQGKLNLNNLVVGNHRSEEDVAIFGRLLASLGLPPQLADAVVDWIDRDGELTSGAGAEDPYYLALPRPYRAANQPMVQVEELYRVKGFDAATVAKLLPYVTALPSATRTPINANTASAELLAAVLPKVPRAAIEAKVAERVKKPFASAAEVSDWVRSVDPKASAGGLDVKSAFFTVRVQVAQDEVELGTEALLERTLAAGKPPDTSVVWRRPRY
ncbi:MAG TPA: type II secretion system minor pseudopilin GspK [Usitatibacter sp.]|jgi:general secretion pathway protein K|nr:type II secretion system minor pseudopilin GspK [Usitatibacter sp.]